MLLLHVWPSLLELLKIWRHKLKKPCICYYVVQLDMIYNGIMLQRTRDMRTSQYNEEYFLSLNSALRTPYKFFWNFCLVWRNAEVENSVDNPMQGFLRCVIQSSSSFCLVPISPTKGALATGQNCNVNNWACLYHQHHHQRIVWVWTVHYYALP